MGLGFHGDVQGATAITDLLVRTHPRYHVAGHRHYRWGPNRYGLTTSVGVAILVPPRRNNPALRVQPGSLAVLDTVADTVAFVEDAWLAEVGTNGFDFPSVIDGLYP